MLYAKYPIIFSMDSSSKWIWMMSFKIFSRYSSTTQFTWYPHKFKILFLVGRILCSPHKETKIVSYACHPAGNKATSIPLLITMWTLLIRQKDNQHLLRSADWISYKGMWMEYFWKKGNISTVSQLYSNIPHRIQLHIPKPRWSPLVWSADGIVWRRVRKSLLSMVHSKAPLILRLCTYLFTYPYIFTGLAISSC